MTRTTVPYLRLVPSIPKPASDPHSWKGGRYPVHAHPPLDALRRLVGTKPTREAVEALAREQGFTSVRFVEISTRVAEFWPQRLTAYINADGVLVRVNAG